MNVQAVGGSGGSVCVMGGSVVSRVKAVVLMLTLLLTSIVGTLTINGLFMPLIVFRPRLYRLLFDFFIGSWQWQVSGLFEKFIGMKVEISGDEIRPNEQSIIIMNHRSCFDWLYFWSLLIRQSGVWTHKIVAKSPLRHLPGLGWAMQCSTYLFLNRRWEDDETHLKKMMKYYAKLDYKTQILIFPEGTDFNAKSKQRSDTFADKNGLVPFSYVLHPRTTGFTFLVSHLQQDWKDFHIYDATIALSSSFPQNEVELFKGVLPNSVHFHVKRYSPSDIPTNADHLAKWCNVLWEEKETRLKLFHKIGRFADQQHSEGSSFLPRTELWLDVFLYISMLLWFSGTILVIVALFRYTLVQFVFVVQIVMFVGLWYKGSGYDVVQEMCIS